MMYADDTVKYVREKDADARLTATVEKVTEWLSLSCRILNTGKTVTMHFSKQSNLNVTPVKVGKQ